jgi:myo-inositol-1(or 4)-monophosphatase
LVHEAGGRLTGLDGLPPRYDRESVRHGTLVAANGELQPDILTAVAEAEREIARSRPVKRPG